MLEALLRGMGWEATDMETDCCHFHRAAAEEDTDDMQVEDNNNNKELIPGLPEDIALECLLKVSYKCHPCLRKVCRRWEKEVTDPVFYFERRKAGTTRHCVCMVQALPAAATAAAAAGRRGTSENNNNNNNNKDTSSKDAPATVYGISMYDLQQRSWEWLPCIPDFPQGLPLFCRMLSLDGKLVVLGGWHPTSWEALRCTHVFCFSTQTWCRGADMPRVRSFFACGGGGGGGSSRSVFVAGGHDDNKTALATADVYDIDADRWELLPDMSEERDEGAGVVLDGKFFAISGYGTNSQGQFSSSADVWDSSAGSWSRVHNLWGAAAGAMAGIFSSGNSSYVVARGELYTFHRQSLMRYCPLRNLWSSVDVVPEATRLLLCTTTTTSVNENLIFAMGSVSCKAERRGLLYQLPENHSSSNSSSISSGVWQVIEFSDDFSGLPQTSCSVEM